MGLASVFVSVKFVSFPGNYFAFEYQILVI